jgi:hypothetical protein
MNENVVNFSGQEPDVSSSFISRSFGINALIFGLRLWNGHRRQEWKEHKEFRNVKP